MFQDVELRRISLHSDLARVSVVRLQHDVRPAEIAQALMLPYDAR